MKKRKFLVYSFLLGLAMLAMPADLFANDYIVIPVSEGENHVENGDVNLDELSGLQLPTGISNLKFQRFYKNGYIEGPDDLCIISFEYDNQTHVVQFKFHELCEKGYINCEGSRKNNNRIFQLM